MKAKYQSLYLQASMDAVRFGTVLMTIEGRIIHPKRHMLLRDYEPPKSIHSKASCELFEDAPDAT